MPKYHQDDCRKLMDDITCVRNVTVLGTGGHGKSTVMDCLGANTGYLAENKIGDVLFTLYRADEKEKKTNYKTNPCHLLIETPYCEVKGEPGKPKTLEAKESKKFLFTMLDTPGHLEYSPEVVAALRMADATLITVGVTDGVGVMLEYMIADSLKERAVPCLFVNKLDISIITLEKAPEELYQDISKVVQSINVALSGAEKLGIKDCQADPQLGNVVFGSAYYGWAFSLRQFAKIYAKKMPGMDEEKMLSRLWGDNFFNAKKKTWTKVEVEDSKRGFCQFILEPIINLHKKILAEDASWEAMATKLGVTLKPADKTLKGKQLLKRVMTTWLNASEAIAEMIATHLPNPKAAQTKRIEHIYKGEMDKDEAKAMAACDKEGPLMMHVVKMTPTGSGRFFATGRVFSGLVKTDKYFIRNPDWDPEDPETAACSQEGRVQSVNLHLAKDTVPIMDCPAGNICSLGGVDQFMTKSATVTTVKGSYNFTPLTFSVSCVYKIAIRPTDNKQLPKLVEGLKRLQKADIIVECKSEPTGDHIVSGCGEEHLKMVLKDLKEEHAGVDFTRGVPTVAYKETVTEESPKPALSKSPNKHNRLYVIACPLGEEVSQAIETHKVNMQQEVKKRARILIDEYGWEKTDCMKIWAFGPNDIEVGGANVLVDQTKGIQYLNEIKESVNSGLNWAARQGPLAEENMRGCRFNLMDVKLHADSIHRGMGQIQPTARRVFFGATLTAGIRFMEPIFKVVISCPPDVAAGVGQAIMAKRGETEESRDQDGKTIIIAYLPIVETLGDEPFSKVLQTKTSGKALATYAFDHWQLINTNPLEKGSKAETIMLDIRERKGLKVEQPDIADYIDRL